MNDNVQDCCRICLDVKSRHVSIFEDSTIILHMKSCLSVNISENDALPKGICDACVSQLNEFYNFQLNARCSQDWLESALQEKFKKSVETKTLIQPLPDSEYNSDSLLEFLNNTENIEEYLNNLGKEDIPSIVNMLDKTEGADSNKPTNSKIIKLTSPKKKEFQPTKMDIDILDTDIKLFKEVIKKSIPRSDTKTKEKLSCFACKTKLDTIKELSQHLSICDNAVRTCIYCNILFDSKQKMREHTLTHSVIMPLTCNCRNNLDNKEKLKHCKDCDIDHIASMGFVYSCKLCHETFDQRFQLYKHAKEHIRKMEERICDICGHTFVGESALAKHKKEEHKKMDSSLLYRCKVCTFTSADRKKIFCHVQKHIQIKPPTRHLCESCGRSFANQSTLKNHFLLHAPKCHKCHICHQGFIDIKARDEHALEHIEMVMCDRCGRVVNSSKLFQHVCG